MESIILKRVVTVAISALAISIFTINAQIKLQKEKSFANELIFLGDISSGTAMNVISAFGSGPTTTFDMHRVYCRIFHDDLTIGLYIDTSNRYDDDMEIALGDDFQTVSESLQSIIDWMDKASGGMSISFDDIQGRAIQINKTNAKDRIQIQVLQDIEIKTITGEVFLTRKQLVKAKSLLNDKARNDIMKKLAALELPNHTFMQGNGAAYVRPQFDVTLESIREELRSIKKELRTASPDEIETIKANIKVLEIRERMAIIRDSDLRNNPNSESLIRSVLSDIQKLLESHNYALAEEGFESIEVYESKYGAISGDLNTKREALYIDFKAANIED